MKVANLLRDCRFWGHLMQFVYVGVGILIAEREQHAGMPTKYCRHSDIAVYHACNVACGSSTRHMAVHWAQHSTKL